MLGRVEGTLRPELLGTQVAQRQAELEEAQQLRHREALRVLCAARAVSHTYHAHHRAVLSVEDLEHVARHVAVRPARQLDRPRLVGWLDAESAQRLVLGRRALSIIVSWRVRH